MRDVRRFRSCYFAEIFSFHLGLATVWLSFTLIASPYGAVGHVPPRLTAIYFFSVHFGTAQFVVSGTTNPQEMSR